MLTYAIQGFWRHYSRHPPPLKPTLTYADVCCYTGLLETLLTTSSAVEADAPRSRYAHVCSRKLAYADVCSRMRTYAHVCSRMLTYADGRCGSVKAFVLTYADVC